MVSLGVSKVQHGDTLDSVLTAAEGVLQQVKTDGHKWRRHAVDDDGDALLCGQGQAITIMVMGGGLWQS